MAEAHARTIWAAAFNLKRWATLEKNGGCGGSNRAIAGVGF